MKLNLGCGQRHLADFVNVDKEPKAKPDVLCDLETFPWPFETASADEIVASHVMEHLGQALPIFLGIMQEIYRILRPGGILEIKTPHHRSDGYWGDPTHVRPITGPMMELFSKANCTVFADKGWPNTPLAEYLNVDFEMRHTRLVLTPYWANKWNLGELRQQDLDHAVATLSNVS